MRPIYVEIEEQPVDLPSTLRGLVKLTQAANALSDLDTRVGEFSWPVTFPLTRKNRQIFEQKQHAQGLDKFRSTDYRYFMRVGGEQFAGTFRLLSIKNGFTGNLIGEGFGWALDLKEKKLNELRFAEVSYDGTQLEAILQKDNLASDIQFPLIAYGNFFAPPSSKTNKEGEVEEVDTPPAAVISYPLSVDDYYYSVYYVNTLKQIFKEIGWSAQGKVLSDPELRRWLILPAGADEAKVWPWGAMLPAAANSVTRQLHESYYETGPGGGFTNTAVAFDETNDVVYFLPATTITSKPGGTRALTPNLCEYIAPVAGVYSFSWAAAISAASQFVDVENTSSVPYWGGFAPVLVGLVVFRGGEGYTDADGGICVNGKGQFDEEQTRVLSYRRLDNPGSFSLKTGAFEGSALNVYLEAADTVRLLLFTRRRYSQTGDGINRYVRKEFHVTTSSVGFACTSFDGPTMLQPALALPPLTQKDFVRDFMVRTNTVPLPDPVRKTVTFVSRREQRRSAGVAIDLSDLVEQDSVEFTPVFGTGVGKLIFNAAETEDPVLGKGADKINKDSDRVELRLNEGTQEKTITGLYAPVGFRQYRLGAAQVGLPCVTDVDQLTQNLNEVDWDFSGYAPRLVRYLGLNAEGSQINVLDRKVIYGACDQGGGVLFAGLDGVVARYYQETINQARRGHLAKCSACLTPALYQQLQPGKTVYVAGAEYEVSAVKEFDPVDEGAQAGVELVRVV